jgi:diguanylate cyclase (GGDEF)-like protein
MPGFAGLLVVPLKSDHDTVVFFRREVTRVVSWLGDLHPENRADVLSPRLSFSAWRQSVSGTSLAWGRVAAEADDLAHELEGALLRRAEAQLASLAMRDSLTGLYNRRALLERLGVASGIAPGRALLFIDLDDFKRINDTLGHEAGDAVIVEVGRRLVVGARLEDLVVRLGGDEFVVMCDSLDRDEALAIADRLVAAIAAPIALARGFVSVTASCGVVVSPEGVSSTNLLEQADRAMYRAKSDGRNRVAE